MIRQLLPSPAGVDTPEALEACYLIPPVRHLRADFVASLDGAIEIGGRSGPLGGPADKAVFMAMRAVADVVMVGAGTVRAERYGPVRLDDDVQRRRRARGQTPLPALAIVSERAELDTGARVFSDGHRPLVLTTAAGAARRPDLASVADVVACGDHRVDVRRVVDVLFDRGLPRVLCEGGPALLRSLLAEGLVDEMCLTFSPFVAGSQHRRLTGEEPLPMPVPFRLAGLLEGDGLVISRYTRLNPS